MQRGKGLNQCPKLLVKVSRRIDVKTEKILPLAYPDDDPDTTGKANDHGTGNELDDTAQPRNSEQQKDDAGHECGDLKALHTVLRHDPRQNDNKSAGWPGNLN